MKSSKTRGTVIGRKVSSGLMTFKGADLTVDFYVGRLDLGVDCEMLKSELEKEGIRALEVDNLTCAHGHFKSFKVSIRKSQIHLMKNPAIWPDGVLVRKFFRPRSALTKTKRQDESLAPMANRPAPEVQDDQADGGAP
jgi:arginyl-tRNA synthetase